MGIGRGRQRRDDPTSKKRKRVESFGIQQLRRQAHMEVRGSDEPFFYPLEKQPQH